MKGGEKSSAPTRRFVVGAGAVAGAAAYTWLHFRRSSAANSYALAQRDFGKLKNSLDGELVLPPDEDYAAASRPVSFNPGTESRPAAIIYSASVDDIARVIEFASTHGLPLAARCGGCDILGVSTCHQGVTLDLSAMNSLTPVEGVNHFKIAAGARAGEINAELAARGRAAPLGCDPMVGVSGLTLGGGLGWLLGLHGAACDSLLAADLVTTNGDLVRASAKENSDLFWGLKGGGGNFGVVAEMTFKTIELSRVIGGYIVYPLSEARALLSAYPALMAQAPRELMVELASIDTARGPVLVAMTCYSGAEKNAEATIAPFLRFGEPLANDIGVRDYQNVGAPSQQMIENFPPPDISAFESGQPPDNFNHWRGCNLVEISSMTASIVIDAIESAPPGGSFGLGHFMKGASVEVDPDETAMPRRPGSMCAYYSASWNYAEQSDHRMSWVDEAIAALLACSQTPTYVNYLASNKERDIKETYGENYKRLSKLKSAWDPENLFNRNRNIRPR